MANKFQIKRTATSGVTPNTTNVSNSSYIAPGELAVNMADRKLFTANTSGGLLELGSNLTNLSVTSSLTLNNNAALRFKTLSGNTVSLRQQDDDNFVFYTTNTTGAERLVFNIYANTTTGTQAGALRLGTAIDMGGQGIYANNTLGTTGQVLTTNGSSVYWSSAGGVGRLAGNGLTSNDTHYAVLANTGIVANSTGTFVNAAYIATVTVNNANNADYLDGQHGSYYAANSQLASYALLSGATFSGAVTFNANVTLGAADHLILSSTSGLSANGTYGSAGQVLHSNGTAVYWAGDDDTTYDLASVANTGANAGRLRLTDSSNANDDVLFVGAGTTTVSSNTTQITITTADQFVGTVTSVASGNGLTGGPITTTGTLSVVANSGLVSNSTGVFVNANTGVVANTTGVFVNSAYIATLTANNANYLQTRTWEAPGTIGSTTANSGAFTSLSTTANANFDSGTLFVDAVNNRVGIGNTAPAGEALDVRGNIRVGGADAGPNYIAFRGTTGDGPGSYNHTYVGERIYSGTEASEMFVFKGNDQTGTADGPDRIRMAAGEFRVDTYSTALSGDFNTVASNTTSLTNKFIVSGNGNVGVGNTTPTDLLSVGGTVAAGNTTITGFVNATSSVNSASLSVGSSIVANTTRLAIGTGVGIQANGTIGTAGQVLTSNGTTVYWVTPAATGVTSVGSGNGLTGGPITSTGSLAVLANSGIVANATGVYVNATYIATLTSNNATYFDGATWAAPKALGTGTANTGAFTTANASVAINVGANVNLSTSQITVGNSTVNTTITATNIGGNSTAQLANTTITGTANASVAINVGANVNLSTTQVSVGNSTVNTTITATNIGGNSTAQLANTTITGFANVSTSVNSALFTVGSTFSANSTIVRLSSNTRFTQDASAGIGSISGVFAYHPEGEFTNHPFLSNDLANLRQRGGTLGANSNITLSSGQFDALFDATPTYLSGGFANTVANTIIEFTNIPTLFWGAGVGISFGSSAWAPTSVVIEALSNGTWVSCYSNTTFSASQVFAPIPGNAGNGTTALRFTLGANTSTRIAHIWAYDYDSDGWSQAAMPRAGGQFYGNVSVNSTSTFSIGTTTINATTFSGTANNATYLNGQLASFYTNATNITTGTLPYAQIPANVINTTASFTRTGITTFSANVVLGSSGLSANGGFGTAGHILHSNGTATYWAADDQGVTSVATANGLSGGTITSTGTIGVTTGPTLTVNTTGIHVNSTLSLTDLTVSGNLTVSGTTTYINTQTLNVGDNLITLNADLGGAVAPTENSGIEVNRGSSANVQFLWDETNDRWSTNGQPLAVSSLVAAGAASGITTLAAGNTTITGFANVSGSIQGGSTLTIAGAASGITTLAAGNTTITGFANVSTTLQVGTNTATFGTAAYIVANGNVGIGTSSPGAKLEVSSTATSGRILLNAADLPMITNGFDKFTSGAYSGAGRWGMFMEPAQLTIGAVAGTGNFCFKHFNADSTSTERMRIDSNGNTGIGNTSPTHKLSVNGTGYFGDDITVNGGQVYTGTTQARVKFAAWSDTGYGMGMQSGYTFGGLVNDFALTFQMSGNPTRGFWWGDSAHTNAQGAMALTSDGKLTVATAARIGFGTSDTTVPGATYALEVNGAFAATTKSFLIDHPTKEGMKLRYGSLEGPENGVYVRGRLKDSNIIELPDYWTGLVDEDTITVNLTPIGRHQKLYVEDITGTEIVVVGNDNILSKDIDCFYTVFAERKDVEKLVVEF